ncbi:MAG TPA: DUF5655 domain-containing protein [Blastocatellia bacterium]|nr:DUF5655 domain-containing protein [Blastocatellia bacterium]
MESKHAIESHFIGRDRAVTAVYDKLLETIRRFGPFTEDPKKTSIHLVRKTAFAGIATRKTSLVLTLKAAADKKSSRIHKREQVSKNRWHLEIKLESPVQVDRELIGWVRQAYDLAG